MAKKRYLVEVWKDNSAYNIDPRRFLLANKKYITVLPGYMTSSTYHLSGFVTNPYAKFCLMD